jgi:drug/metabolite transporter (DMT)-like permease
MTLGRFFAILAALASSQTPVFSRALKAEDWTSWQVIGARALIGAIVLFPFVATRLRASVPHIRLVGVPAAMFVIGGAAYVYATMNTAIGVAVSVLYLSPMWVTLYERFVRGERRDGDIIACVFGTSGVALLTIGVGTDAIELSGVLAALLASATNAIYILAAPGVTQKIHPSVVAFWSLLLAGFIFGVTLPFAPWSVECAPNALGIGVVSGALYFVIAYSSMARIGTEFKLWMYGEVLVVWAFGAIAFGDRVTALAVLGSLAIVSAGLIATVARVRGSKPA